MISARNDLGKLDCPCGDQPLDSSTAPLHPVAASIEWRTHELKELEDAVNSALRAEGVLLEGVDAAGAASEGGGKSVRSNVEPESEAPAAGEAVQAGIERLRLALMRQVITPLLESPWPAVEEEAWPVRQLPVVIEHTSLLLKKTWALACARGQQLQQLTKDRAAAETEVRSLSERLSREEAGRLAAEAEAGQGEKAHDMLEGTVSRLTAARKTIKEKEWELNDARRRVDDLERERTTQARRIRDLETALERHIRTQTETESRCSAAHLEADAEAAQQRGELRRQLAAAELARDGATAKAAQEQSELHRELDSAKLARDGAQAEVAAAARREDEAARECSELRQKLAAAELARDGAQDEAVAAMSEKEARLDAERHSADLQARLAESLAQLAESQVAQDNAEQRLQTCTAESQVVQEELEQRLRSLARPRAKGRQSEGQASAQRRDTSVSPDTALERSRARESDENRRHAATDTPQRERATASGTSRQSGAGLPRAGFGMAAMGRPPPAARRSKGGLPQSASEQGIDQEGETQQPSALARPASMKSMPMDLKSLGKMLAGSGGFNKGKS